MVVGNKTDLAGRRVVTYEEGKRVADQWKAEFLETSAKVGDVSALRLDLQASPVLQVPNLISESQRHLHHAHQPHEPIEHA